jgi:release factor glutamine methyltransferase
VCLASSRIALVAEPFIVSVAAAQGRSVGERMRLDSAALAQALGVPFADARRELQTLLCRALEVDLGRLVAHPESRLEVEAAERYEKMLWRRLAQEPMAYILGEREFFGFAFEVTPAVLIPRPETELLVELAMKRVPRAAPWRILDLGTGSGCIGITLAHLLPHSRVIATDASEAALQVAARNAQRWRVANLELRQGSWFDPVAGERFDLIVSNPPYVAQGDPHLGVGDLRFEPRSALSAGSDGMEALCDIIADAPRHLVAGGWLLLEHGYDQVAAVSDTLRTVDFEQIVSRTDLAGIPRITGGRRP